MVYGPIVPTSCRHAALPTFSLLLCLVSRVLLPLRLAGALSLSLSLSLVLASPPPLLSHFYSIPVSRTRVVPSTCTLLSRCILLRSMSLRLSSRPCPRHGYPAASAKAGNSDRGSESVLAEERERERERERGLIPERDNDITVHEKRRETRARATRTHAHDRLIHA